MVTEAVITTAKAVVVGAGSAIGSALVEALHASGEYQVHAVARTAPVVRPPGVIAYGCDHSDAERARVVEQITSVPGTVERLVICLGVLHGEEFAPERALRNLDEDTMLHVLRVNTVLPMLWLAAFAPAVRRAQAPVLAALSARVGSIADNRLGGWYSYRASKAALNMMLRSAAIEIARTNRNAAVLAFHPGTTDSPLSQPFQANVPAEKLFTPAFVAARLLAVMDTAEPGAELNYRDWDNAPIPW